MVESSITGLSPSTVYFYQVVAISPVGSITYGDIQTFTTIPVSDFTFTNLSGASLVATIVDGLSANSDSITIALNGTAVGDVVLTGDVLSSMSGETVQFSLAGVSDWRNSLSVNLGSVYAEVNIRVRNIPGNTSAGPFSVKIEGTDGSSTASLLVNLQVNKIISGWQEF